jgi:hypothetical protein
MSGVITYQITLMLIGNTTGLLLIVVAYAHWKHQEISWPVPKPNQ